MLKAPVLTSRTAENGTYPYRVSWAENGSYRHRVP